MVKPKTIGHVILISITGIFVLALLAVVLCGYSLLYTSAPMASLERSLRQRGYEVNGMTGSLNSGVDIARFGADDLAGSYELQGVKLRYSGLYQLFFDQRIVIDTLTIEHVRLKLRAKPEVAAADNVTEGAVDSTADSAAAGVANVEEAAVSAPTSGVPGQDARTDVPLKIVDLQIRDLDIRDTQVEDDRLPKPIAVESLRATGLVFRPEDAKAELGRFSLRSDICDVDVAGITIDGEELRMQDDLVGTIKRGAHPFLKKDVSVRLRLAAVGRSLKSLVAQLMDDRVRIEIGTDQSVVAAITDWTPSEYLNTALPLEQIRLNVQAPHYLMAAMNLNLSGGFRFQGVPFVLASTSGELASREPGSLSGAAPQVSIAPMSGSPLRAFHRRGTSLYEMDFHPMAVVAAGGPLQIAWATIRSNRSKVPQTVLADLLYDRPYEVLDPVQRGGLRQNLRNFLRADGRAPAAE